MQIKGYIKEGDTVSLTCCEKIHDLIIDEESLYSKLDTHFNLDNEKHFNGDKDAKSPLLGISYVILEQEPDKNISFEDLVANVSFSYLTGEYISGCYSEWTCGYGGFDFFIRTEKEKEGHSIFAELNSNIGKWVWLNVKSIRSAKIDTILNKITK